MDKIIKIGDYDKISDIIPPEGEMCLIYHPIDLFSTWKRCSLTADFLASFYSYSSSGIQDEDCMYTISTITNELIENSVKFSTQKTKVNINIRHYTSILVIEVTNYISDITRQNFENYCNEIFSNSVEELYFNKLESKSEDDTSSGIGILMMLKDYPVDIGFCFENLNNGTHHVKVRAYISLKGDN